MDVANLDPVLLFTHFEALSRIPRGSGNEAAAREFIKSWARQMRFDLREDAIGNVVVAAPATPGHESAPVIVLQGHIDMVCENTPDSKHDWTKDPVRTWVDGDVVRARGTTLGADNGIGVAAAMAVAEDPTAVHGPLELLCTIDEETGMTGAFNLTPGLLRGRTMLNLDSEDEGTLFIGCAGGGDSAIVLKAARADIPAGAHVVSVKVSGLKGGHSGLDIGRNRGNALRLVARAIDAGLGGDLAGLRLAGLKGGSKKNAIPRDAAACVWLAPDRVPAFVAAVGAFEAVAREELGAADPGLAIVAGDADCDIAPFDADVSARFVRMMLALPHGPVAMSQDIPGLVETSTNLAIAEFSDDGFTVHCNSRSSVAPAMEAVRAQIRAVGGLAGAQVTLEGKYPGWRPNTASPILARARDVWKRVSGKDALVTAIHAGLECGVLGERVPGLDMVSFGPDIRGAHSPDEHVSIPSTKRFYEFLKALLADLA
jgi:dipeptidase D